MRPQKVAVVGTGYLGAVHARIYHELADAELVAVVDVDGDRAGEIGRRFGVPALTDHETLLEPGRIDAVSIATPTTTHHAIAKQFLEAGIACLVEKPITTTLTEAEDLCAIAGERGVPLSVGHVERFNPAFLALRDHIREPKFIEAHRLTPFRFRSTDIGVVLDLMIHDLDLILTLVKSEVVEIQAAGVNILSARHEDIANCRLTFADGTVANLTASRISEHGMRRIRFFTPECYATVDLQKRQAQVYRRSPTFRFVDEENASLLAGADADYLVYNKFIDVQKVTIDDEEPLKLELRSFVRAIAEEREPIVTGEHGLRAIRLAFRILDAIDGHIRKYMPNMARALKPEPSESLSPKGGNGATGTAAAGSGGTAGTGSAGDASNLDVGTPKPGTPGHESP